MSKNRGFQIMIIFADLNRSELRPLAKAARNSPEEVFA
jgi:hypothetical protein